MKNFGTARERYTGLTKVPLSQNERHVSFSLARFNVRPAICHHVRGRGGSAAPSSASAARTDGKNIGGFAAQNLSSDCSIHLVKRGGSVTTNNSLQFCISVRFNSDCA